MVSFSSENEKIVYEELTKIDTQLGQIYYSGLVVLRQKKPSQLQILKNSFSEITKSSLPNSKNIIEENPDRIAQSAHSMRETINVLTRHPKIKPFTSKVGLKIKIQKVADPDPNLPEFLQTPYNQLTKLHAWFVRVLHHSRDPPSEQEYLGKVEEFTALMAYILTPHYEVIQKIDEFIQKSNPDKEDLEKLEFLMSKNTQSYNYFFKNAKSNWLQILVIDGKYFKKIPFVKKENSYLFPFWPESYYLERVAADKPELVEKIISQIPTPKRDIAKYSTVLSNFVGAAINMPPQIGKLIADKAIKKKWRGVMPYSILEKELADLMLNLVDTEFETALNLCRFLLDIILVDSKIPDQTGISQKNIRSVIDSYNFEEILKKDIPILCEKDHDAVLQILIKKLFKANLFINRLHQKSEKNSQQDISFVWRPAIEDHEQNYGFDLRSDIVTAIRKILEKSESIGINSLKKSLVLLKEQNYYIFRRLEIYFFGRHPLEFTKEVNQLSIEYYGKEEFKHEHYHMLKNSYPSLKAKTQEKILNIISKGPDFNNFPGTGEEFEIYKKHWKIKKLSPIIEYLPKLQDEYNTLVKKYGISDLTEFVSYHKSVSQVTYTSDLSENMSISKVINFIKSYRLPQGVFLEEDGSGRTFKEFVEKNPEEYSKYATELISCHELFQFRFLDGLTKIKDKKLDWNSILTFCEYVIVTSPSRDNKILELILNYFGDLLQYNLVHNKTAIPFDLQGRVWKILEKAIEIAPPDTDWSKNYPNNNWDIINISINSSIGRLCYALIQYATWCYYGIKNKGITPTELVPEVKALLESKLDSEQEQSISMHAVLGYHFFNLLAIDEEWTKSKISLIFTRMKPHTKAGNAAWDAYMENQIYQKSFNVLFDEYMYRIPHTIYGSESSYDISKKLAEQIGLIYLYNLDRSEKLFESFLEKSNPEILDECITYIGRTLKKWKIKDSPEINISKLLSYKKIKSSASTGWLFLNPSMPKSERIELLNSTLDETHGKISPIHQIPEEMENFVEEFPFETITCVEKMIRGYQTNNEIYTMLPHFEKIFSKIRTANNENAINKMKDIVNFLGSLGHDRYKRFLD